MHACMCVHINVCGQRQTLSVSPKLHFTFIYLFIFNRLFLCTYMHVLQHVWRLSLIHI